MTLTANPDCCEEAAPVVSFSAYIPCNKPAAFVVGWKHRAEQPIRMCEMCTRHNIKNRSGYIVRAYLKEEVVK